MSWLPPDDEDDDDFGYDESDVRIRPNPKGSRPRTKQRPSHDDAVPGLVLGVDRGRYTVLVADPDADVPVTEAAPAQSHEVVAKTARELGRGAVTTGDHVALVGDVTGAAGSLARIVRVEERSTLLRRSADDTDAVERVIVANAEQMLVVVAAANPEPRPRLVDRYLVAAIDAGIRPILVVTKTDLADPAPFLAQFDGLGLTVFTRRTGDPIDDLREVLAHRSTVAVGHSGVGKSTLVNALVPGADRATGHVNEVTGRGRHTSSSTVSLRLPGGGWVIDTPGVRSFGLGHVDPDHVLHGFADLAPVVDECPRGCTHLDDAPDCELDDAVADGRLDAARVDSARRLIQALRGAAA